MKPFASNLILLTDSYKVSHYRQYPAGTTRVFSFFESRGGKWRDVVFYGLQYYIKEYLCGRVITDAKIDAAKVFLGKHFGNPTLMHEEGWRYIVREHGGRLPVKIRAVAEGSVIPNSNVLMTVENTDPNLPWLTNYIETLLVMVWYTSTIATQSREMKKILLRYLEETGTPEDIFFKLHDFGFRGSTSVESAAIGDSAHLLSFLGTDTMPGILFAMEYYGADVCGFSIPAAEHSTITSWGRKNEGDAYGNMLRQFPNGLVAVVSDSYNIFRACEELWGQKLRAEVLNREGVLVVRPDSGDPVTVVLRVLEILGNAFSTTINAKGYRVLNPKVRVIQGDGIDIHMMEKILEATKQAGWSADNIAFGSGGGLLQNVNRDTLKFAFKASAVEIDGVWHDDVMKDPVTDPGKKSKAGRLILTRDFDGAYHTVHGDPDSPDNLLATVFCDGELLIDQNFVDIKSRVELPELLAVAA